MALSDRHAKILEARGLDAELLERLGVTNFIRADGDCLIWTGPTLNNGYGRFGGTTLQRFIYQEFIGPIPNGLEVDHVCRNKLCCMPAHLEAVTHRENMRRRYEVKSSCPKGHPWISENIRTEKRGSRRCRICQNDAERERQRRKRQEAKNAQ